MEKRRMSPHSAIRVLMVCSLLMLEKHAAAGPQGEPNSQLYEIMLAQRTATVQSVAQHVTEDTRYASDRAAALSGIHPSQDRHLQSVCTVSEPFTVSSTVYPAAEGCFVPSSEPGFFISTTTSYTIATVALPSSSSSAVPQGHWAAGTIASTSSSGILIDVDCYSEDPLTEAMIHPVEFERWVCFVGYSYALLEAPSFGADCGCEGDTSTSEVPSSAGESSSGTTPSPAISSSSASTSSPLPNSSSGTEGGSSCGSSESFAVSSSLSEDLEGCYELAGTLMDNSFFSQTGEIESGAVAVYAGYVDQDAIDARWFVGTYVNSSSNGSGLPTCISKDSPSAAHPSDAVWTCDLTGDFQYDSPSVAQFDVQCTCDGERGITSTSDQLESDTSEAIGTESPVEDDGTMAPDTPSPITGSDTPSPMSGVVDASRTLSPAVDIDALAEGNAARGCPVVTSLFAMVGSVFAAVCLGMLVRAV